MTWELDHDNIEEAKRFLGINLPVHFDLDGFRGTYGAWTLAREGFLAGEPEHEILLAPDQTAEEASRTAWHELCHAAQFERLGVRARDEVVCAMEAQQTIAREAEAEFQRLAPRLGEDEAKHVYVSRQPCEAEAVAHELLHDALPLTKPLD